MKTFSFLLPALFSASLGLISCNDGAGSEKKAGAQGPVSETSGDTTTIREEPVTYTLGGTTFKGYVSYDASRQEKRPIVLVVPEWWGLTAYPRMRAKKLAQLGYLAMAVDMYGEGRTAANPEEAQKETTPFYANPRQGKERLDAALVKAKTFSQADPTRTAAIGYCFGGSVVLNAAKLGSDLDAVVSFHGGLEGVPADKRLLKSKILVCHGAADSFVPPAQVAAFRKSMDSIGADYVFKMYPNATHAFTNPAADDYAARFKMPIKYNPAADSASWNDMKAFLKKTLQ